MKFDNSQFEKNCRESMSTLDKLKEKITGSNSADALSGLSKAANNVDLSGLAKSVDAIANRFSTLGIVGMTIVSNLTTAAMNAIAGIASKIQSMIVGGGMSRALNIEQARFQISGLKKDWDALSEDIDYAVSGTAYGFDAAAKAAAQLSASGVEAGDAMKAALRGISGVAAMANVTYEEISPIFTTVAGQGKLMTMQLRQLEARGLNVAATLGEQLGYSEAQIREMVTEGQINFEMFSKAMDDAFGEHAKDANKTFTGVIANIRAAFARIGADFITPIVTQESPIVLMLQKVRERVVEIKEYLQPLVKVWVNFVEYVGKLGQRLAKNFDIKIIMLPFYNILFGIINLFKTLYSILKPIGDAIKQVFPTPFYILVIQITKAFADFTEKLRLSNEHAAQLKTAFKGVFDIIKLVFDGIKGGLQIIFGMSDGVGSLSDAFFNAIESIGLFLSNIANTIRQSKTLHDIFNALKEGLTNFANGVSNALSSMGGADASGFSKFASDLQKATGPIEIFGAVFKGVFDLIWGIASTVMPVVTALVTKFCQTIEQAMHDAAEAIKGGDATAATNLVTGSLLGFIVYWLKETISDIDGIVAKIKDVLKGNVLGLLGSLKSVLLTYQKELRAETLLKIAEAVGILAISIVMLTGIDTEKMASAMAAISILLGEVALITSHLMKMQGPLKECKTVGEGIRGLLSGLASAITTSIQISAVANAIMTIASSVLVLAIGVKMLASLSAEDLTKGMVAITVLLGEMALLAKFLTANQGEITKGLSKFIGVAIAIDLLAIAVKSLAVLSFNDLIKGLAGVGALLFEIQLFAKALNAADVTKMAGKMISLAIGLDLLVIAVRALGSMPLVEIGKGLLGVGVMLAEIAVFSKVIDPTKLTKSAMSLIPIAIAMDLLAVAVKSLGALDLTTLGKGLGGVAVLLTELGLFVSLVKPNKILALSAGMLVLSVSMGIMAGAIRALGAMNLTSLAKGLGAIGAVLVELGLFTKLVKPAKLIGVSAGILVFSAAMIPFATAMALLSTISLGGMVIALVSLAGALTIFGVASALLTPVIPAMLGVSAALGLLGVAALAAGAGVTMISTALIALAGFGVAGVTALAGTLSALAGLIPTIVSMLGQLAAELMTKAITLVPQFAEMVVVIIAAILATLAAHIPEIVESGVNIIVGLLEGIAQGLPRIAKAAVDIIVGFLTAIGEEIPRIVDAGFKMIISFIEGMAQSIRDNTPLMINAVNELMESVVFAIGAWIGNFINGGADLTNALMEGIKSVDGPATAFVGMCEDAVQKVKDKVKDIKEAAKNFIQGFIDGITGKKDEVSDAAADVGSAAVDGLNSKGGIDSHSPSVKTTQSGEYFCEGFENALADGESGAYDAALAYGQSAADGLDDSYIYDKLAQLNTDLGIAEADSGKNVNDMKKEQIATRKANAEAAKKETTAIDANTEATKKNGGAAKSTKDDIKDLTDAFKDLEKGQEVSIQRQVNNLALNTQEVARWAQDMKQLMGTNLDETIKQSVLKMGVAGHETVKAYLRATEEQTAGLNTALQANLTLNEKAEDYILGKYDQLGTLIGQTLDASIMTWSTSLADAIQNAIDPFAKFDNKAETTTGTLIENMQSQIDGMTQWSNWIYDIMARTGKSIDDTFIQSLIEMGPKSYDQIHAMATATDEQLQQIVGLWDTQAHLGETLAIEMAGRMSALGINAGQGFVDGLAGQNGAIGTAVDTAFGTNGAEKAEGIWETASPSKRMIRLGLNICLGLKQGLERNWAVNVNTPINRLGNQGFTAFKNWLGYDKGNELGLAMDQGLAAGINAGASNVINAAVSTALAAYNAAKAALDINSPSKVFRELGRYIDEGWSLGIQDKEGTVVSAVDEVANSTIDQMKAVIASIAENVQNEFDGISPVITPQLDLSELQNGKSTMDRLLAAQTSATLASNISASLGGSNAINQPNTTTDTQPVSQQIIFNQTNNSPKNIDPYESYRLNRLAAEQLKGAFR